jgi:hypothetical protein
VTRPLRYVRDLLDFLRRRWYMFVALVIVGSYMAWFAHGAIEDGKDRRASRAHIESLASQIKSQNDRIASQTDLLLRIASDIENATSPQAQARSAATLAQAIADIRRSINCAALDTQGTDPSPCADTDARLDQMRAGIDPFAPKGP